MIWPRRRGRDGRSRKRRRQTDRRQPPETYAANGIRNITTDRISTAAMNAPSILNREPCSVA
jgi:hypothetical protein